MTSPTLTSTSFNLGPAAAIPDRDRKVFVVGALEIGVFRIGEKLFAYENSCPHMQGPVCQGKIVPRAEEPIASDGASLGLALSKTALHVACPRHGYEFDIETGRHPGNRQRLRSIPLAIENGDIVITVSTGRLGAIASLEN